MADVLIEVYDESTSSKVFTFGEDGWRITDEIDGLGNITPNLQTTNLASGYGVAVTACNVGARYLTVTATNVKTTDRSAIRNEIQAALKPGFTEYTLVITYMGRTRELHHCRISSYKVTAGNIHSFLSASFTFMAADPLFYATDYKELFFNGSEYSGDIVNQGSAPALPIITLTGAIKDGYSLAISGIYRVNAKPLNYASFTDATLDFETCTFSPLENLSFSTEVHRIFILSGPVLLKQNTSGVRVNVKFRERYWGL